MGIATSLSKQLKEMGEINFHAHPLRIGHVFGHVVIYRFNKLYVCQIYCYLFGKTNLKSISHIIWTCVKTK